MTVRLGIDTDQLQAGAARAKKVLTGLAKAAVGLGVGAPVAAAVATAVMGIAGAAAAAGLAYKAFQVAAGPQMEAVKSVAELAAAAQEAAAEGGKKATEAQKAYNDALADLPPATRATAKAYIGLQKDHQKWSDGLAGTTMPVYLKGINLLRRLLPMLTPFVKAAAGAISGFFDSIGKGLKSARFKDWASDMSTAAGPALTNFLTVIKNLAVGIAGLLQAFLPASDGMTGGLVSMTGAFAAWGAGLKGSDGLADFTAFAEQGGKTLGALAKALGTLLVAAAPVLGATATLALYLANVINSTPAPVLKVLAAVLVAVKVGMIAYKVGAGGVAVANRLMASSSYLAITGWARMMAVGLMAYVRLGAAAVASAARTAAAWVGSALVSIGTWIAAVVRASITAVLQFALMAARAVAWAVIMAAQWLIAMGPIGWVIAAVIGLAILIIANWDKIKKWTAAAWTWVWSKIKGTLITILSFVTGWVIVSYFLRHWDRIKSGTVSKVTGLIAYVRGMPGRILGALASLGNLLYSKGVAVVQGLWRGISSMGGWLKGQLMSFAKSMIPGPIAKALGINSPAKVTTVQGRWIGKGLGVGLLGTARQVKAASEKLAGIVRGALAPGKGRARALGKIAGTSKALISLAKRDAVIATRLQSARKSLAAQVKARDKLMADIRKGVMDSANITQLVQDVPVTATSLIAGLTAKVAQAKQFAADLAKLRKRGVSADLIAQIAQAGVEQGSASATALANASSAQIKELNNQQKALSNAATAAGAVAGNAMYGTGIQAAQGLIQGLASQQKAIEKQMVAMAKGMTKAIKRALGINSPSRLMAREVGRHVPTGVEEGAEDNRGSLDRTMRHLVDVPGIKKMQQARTGGGAAGTTDHLIVELAGAPEFKALIRGIVRKDGGGSVQKTFGRGKEQTA
ncbi:hypothetical protein ABZ351_18120 [Streptomyces microflavus]|uniref:hypothetical protein n=1 Tax=Streptomyces microflavus TaxID=1919 RepID=UPI0033F25F13